jgi:hypothetical protein
MIITAVFFSVVVVTVNARIFSMVEGITMKEIKPQAAYTIDTARINQRIYEFNTRIKPIMHCIVLIASSNKLSAPTMQYYKIEK